MRIRVVFYAEAFDDRTRGGFLCVSGQNGPWLQNGHQCDGGSWWFGPRSERKGGVGEQRFPHPRGEFDRAVGRMHADALEHVDQVGVGIDLVQPACHQQTIREANIRLRRIVPQRCGLRLRRPTHPGAVWSVERFGDASHLADLVAWSLGRIFLHSVGKPKLI